MKYTLLITFLVLASGSFAQSYLITAQNDSIPGRFSFMEDSKKHEYVRIDTEDGRKTFQLLEVKKLVDKKGNVYKPLFIEGKYRFGKEMVAGYLSKYMYTPQNSSQKFQEEVLIKMDGSTLVVPGTFGFKALVSEFLSECPRVSNAVKNKKYKQYETDQLVKDFNQCMLEGEYAKRTSAADIASSLETSKLSDDQSQMIADFKTQLNNSVEVENKEESLEMFDDIVAKLSKGETIPNYLKNAFKRSISSDKSLVELYKKLVEKN